SGRGVSERHEPLLAPLASCAQDPARKIHVFEIEIDELAETQPRCVEQLENRAITATEYRGFVRHVEEPRHLFRFEMRRERLLLPRRPHERRRVFFNEILANQIPRKRSQ